MTAPFATPDDVAARWRPLTSNEEFVANALCLDASSVIRARFPGIDGQVAAGSMDAGVVLMVCANMVKRALVAPPDGVAQQSETTGPFSRSHTFANPLGNVFLTAAETLAIIGYQPGASSHSYGNDTVRCHGDADMGIVYTNGY